MRKREGSNTVLRMCGGFGKAQAAGYTLEELEMVLAGMGAKGTEELGSMGNDAPLAFLSRCPQLTFNYFKQLFAQVCSYPAACGQLIP